MACRARCIEQQLDGIGIGMAACQHAGLDRNCSKSGRSLTSMSIYELAILGAATPEERATLTATLTDIVSDFGLTLGDDIVVHNAETLGGRHKPADRKSTRLNSSH